APDPSMQGLNQGSRVCNPSGSSVFCDMPNGTEAQYAFQIFAGIASAPGPVEVRANITALRNDTGIPSFEAQRTESYTLQVISPVPQGAGVVSRTDGPVTLYGWTSGGLLGLAGAGCLGGAQAQRDLNLSQGVPGVVCLLAIPSGTGTYRVNVTIAPPAGVTMSAQAFATKPFTMQSGGTDAPVAPFTLQPGSDTALGPGEVPIGYVIELSINGTWTALSRGELRVPYTVTKPVATVAPAKGLPNLALQVPILAAAIGGLGYLAYQNRKPKLQPRSQAMRSELEGKRGKGEGGDGGAAMEAQVEAQRQEVQEAAWDKKRKILEAKREDVLKSIRIAEERKERGEITEHVLAGIRERKERQLEQVEKELEELR
ncbi:MAG: hypothetical protein ACREN5_07770, partial [Gemmatimonadales bacterium]